MNKLDAPIYIEDAEPGVDLDAPTCPRCMVTMSAMAGRRWSCPVSGCRYGGKRGSNKTTIIREKKRLHDEAVEAAEGKP